MREARYIVRPMSNAVRLFAPLLCTLLACGRSQPTTPTPAPMDPTERGGRAFDRWSSDPGMKAGVTPEGARLKDLYGWDLRGTEGLYGAAYANKATALPRNWLTSTESATEIAALLAAGTEGGPALATYLDDEAIGAIAGFIVGVRDGALPRPDWIWDLSAGTPGNYRLRDGADAARGHALIAEQCADCHGPDGTGMRFDDGAFTLGSHARQKAYEDWFKILNGQPGTDMGRQVTGDGRAMAQQIHDILAALCDRTRYPASDATGGEVPDGDPRCGAYLR